MKNQEEQIIAYLLNTLSADDRQAFEQQLAQDAALQEELEVFRTALATENTNAYLDGELSKEEAIRFEQKISQSPALKQEIKNFQLIDNLTDAVEWGTTNFKPSKAEYERIKQLVQTLERKPNNTIIRQLPRYWAVAAGLLLLVSLSIAFLFLRQRYSDETLAANNFSVYTANISLRNASSPSIETTLSAAFTLYQNQEYASVIQQLTDFPVADSNYTVAQFLLGNAYLALENSPNAIQALQNTLQNPPSDLPSYKIQWYLALAHLANGDDQQAQSLLETVRRTANDSFYEEQVDALLKQMDSPWRRITGND